MFTDSSEEINSVKLIVSVGKRYESVKLYVSSTEVEYNDGNKSVVANSSDMFTVSSLVGSTDSVE